LHQKNFNKTFLAQIVELSCPTSLFFRVFFLRREIGTAQFGDLRAFYFRYAKMGQRSSAICARSASFFGSIYFFFEKVARTG